MAKVRMYHPASDRYQWDADVNFEAFHQPEGWVLAPEDDAPEAEPVADDAQADADEGAAPEAEPVADDAQADAEPPKRGRSK